jgi:ankyrin repeat protein
VSQLDENGTSLLMFAAEAGNAKAVRVLSDTKKIEVDKDDKNSRTALMYAVGARVSSLNEGQYDEKLNISRRFSYYDQNRYEIVKYLIDQGASVDKVDGDGNSPLIYAAEIGNLDIVRGLVDTKQVEINQAKRDGMTVLMVASGSGHAKVVQYLIELGAILYKIDKDGRTALMHAAKSGHLDVVKVLNDTKTVDLNQTNNQGKTALMIAAENGHVDVVKYLVEQGAAVDKVDQEGWFALTHAAKAGHLDIVKFFIDTKKVDVNQTKSDGMTTLMIASHFGHVHVVKYLIEQNAQIEQVDNDGTTALMWAAQKWQPWSGTISY